ncbi:MAG: hypothetical protein JKY48_01335, partial [Flavobacteriales bacterium]|nr:hypothetical protein [Flavobacteriales bacterium]
MKKTEDNKIVGISVSERFFKESEYGRLILKRSKGILFVSTSEDFWIVRNNKYPLCGPAHDGAYLKGPMCDMISGSLVEAFFDLKKFMTRRKKEKMLIFSKSVSSYFCNPEYSIGLITEILNGVFQATLGCYWRKLRISQKEKVFKIKRGLLIQEKNRI